MEISASRSLNRTTGVSQVWLRVEKELACGFGPCHKAGYEKSNSTQANAGKVLAPAATLQPYSQSPGTSTGPRACGGGEESHLPSVEPRGQPSLCATDARLGTQ